MISRFALRHPAARMLPPNGCSRIRLVLATIAVLVSACGNSTADEQERFFESQIRPLLVEHCLECHGPTEQSGELRLDSRDHLLKGGESGPVVIPGNPNASRLIQAVRRSNDLAMPPEKELGPQQIAALEHWVQLGAQWPQASGPLTNPKDDVARNHWAFQAVRRVVPPTTRMKSWSRTPVDAFVLRRLEQQQLSPSPAADARTLIRRAAMGLTGLVPAPDAVDTFVDSDNQAAWEEVIDDLLESPAYGEQWARHWLDIARYSDTKGYVYAREERRWVHAWSYRDWVIDALNSDMSYDRFLLLQLAADQVPDCDPHDLAAMGFLTLGRRFLGVTRDIMDDRIDTITRGTMGLTVACARCHDHKYDPIPTTDYYSLYGVLHSCEEQRIELPAASAATADWQEELTVRRKKFQDRYNAERLIAAERCRDMLGEYLKIQLDLNSVPPQGFDQILLPDDVLPEFARRWDEYLRSAKLRNDPVFRHWHAFAELSAEQFVREASLILNDLRSRPPGEVNRRMVAAFSSPPASFIEVIDVYEAILVAVRDQWRELVAAANADGTELPSQLNDPEEEQLRQVLYGLRSPCEVPDERLVHTEYLFTTAVCSDLWQLQKEIDRWINSAPHQPVFALTLADRSIQTDPRVFKRGNPKTPGRTVPRRFLSVLTNDPAAVFQSGSGRLELAKAITDPDNPLTARVIVNRVWAWHFGRGLVDTPSDFGVRAGQPSHPDLLDWLARDFIDHDWSLKHLHRRILLSATYRQSSAEPTDAVLADLIRQHDPSNRLLWRMSLHRLTFEEFRDSILAVSGELDRNPGGRPDELFADNPSLRRTIYGEIDRQFFPTALRVFDVANPDIHIAQRSETTVPQQALFYLNHSLVHDRARQLAAHTSTTTSSIARIEQMFRHVLQRSPNSNEINEAQSLIGGAASTPSIVRTQVRAWSYLYGKFDDVLGKVVDAEPLPHFTGSEWQGSSKYPDDALGWVRLSATGGHPGNDLQHACVRRWTAPHEMKIVIESKLIHEAEPGDGIRVFLVSSRTGQLAGEHVHQQSVDLNVDSVAVVAGETIDFVADIGDGLNNDQFLWQITIRERGSAETVMAWDSRTDFTGPVPEPLSPWEQLAQVLLCSNEFLFVD